MRVHLLAPDPFCRGIDGARHLNEHIGRHWPTYVDVDISEWSVFSMLLLVHAATTWERDSPGWGDAVPSLVSLAHELIATHELTDMAADGVSVVAAAAALSDRLVARLPDVERFTATSAAT